MSDWLDAEAHADRALEMFESGRWAEAESELRKALALNPEQAEWHYNLGLTLEAGLRDLEALGCFQRAVELSPEHPEARLAAGIVCNRLGRHSIAINWLNSVLQLDDHCEPAYAHKIASLVSQEKHDEAETTFYLAQQILTTPSAACLAAIAESLIQRELYDRAGWCLREALRLDSSLPHLRARLAVVAAASGKPQRALQLYLRDLRDDPGNVDTLLDYGELLVDLGRLPEAAEKFRRILELEPANVEAHFKLGQLGMMSQCYEQAHLEFELVLKLAPDFPRIRLAVADALLRKGQIETAVTYLQEQWAIVKESEPGAFPTGALFRMGELMLEADQPQPAVDVFQRILNLSEESPEVLRKLALARFKSGDQAGGVAISRRVLRLEPNCIVSLHNLALAAYEDKQIPLARAWLKRGLRVDRHDEEIRRLRIRCWLAWLPDLIRRTFNR